MLAKHHANAEKTFHRSNVIYPSEMARADWCPRATFYRMSGRTDNSSNWSFALENVFAEGDRIHEKWQDRLAKTGKLWGDWKCSRCSAIVIQTSSPDSHVSCVGPGWVDLSNAAGTPSTYPHDWKYKEVTLKAPDPYRISGHADGALTGHDCLIEIKSVGLGTLRFDAPKLYEDNTVEVDGRKIHDIEGMWKNLKKPLLSHIKQGNIYMWMAKEMGLPFDKIVFLYEFKANQQVKEFLIRPSAEIMAPMLDTARAIVYALGTYPAVPPACPKGGCASCRAYEKRENEDDSGGKS